MKRASFIKYLFLIVAVCSMASCHKKLKPAEVLIVDPVRHYYPVIQGDMMDITYEVENISDNPLFIQEIQTTCGCIIPIGELPIVILPHKEGIINLTYNTIKNTGYVEHYIYCYGNFQDSTCVELRFDTNVVPQADYIRDYEELWHDQNEKMKNSRKYADGTKNYYTDSANQ